MIKYNKSLFIHVPKTGGSWVRDVLIENNGQKFSYPHDLPEHHAKAIKKLKLVPFSFVRHPLELVYSFWKHWSGDENCRINNLNKELYWQWDKKAYGVILANCIVENDINSTVFNFVNNYPAFFSKLIEAYTEKCVYVGRYETIIEDLIDILYKINGSIHEDLLADIYEDKKVNKSKGDEGILDKKLSFKFISTEPVCFKYKYTYLPKFVSQ